MENEMNKPNQQVRLNERVSRTIGDLIIQNNVLQLQVEELQEELVNLRIKLGEVNQLNVIHNAES